MLSHGTLLYLESCSSLFCQTAHVLVTYNAVMTFLVHITLQNQLSMRMSIAGDSYGKYRSLKMHMKA